VRPILGLRGWEVGNGQGTTSRGGGILAPCTKLSHKGSVLTNNWCVALDLGWEGVESEGYTGVEGLGSGEQVVREDGVDLGCPPKPSCWGSVLANETRGVARVCWGRCPEEGKCGVEVVGVRTQVAPKPKTELLWLGFVNDLCGSS
jgi:hypothetical protein